MSNMFLRSISRHWFWKFAFRAEIRITFNFFEVKVYIIFKLEVKRTRTVETIAPLFVRFCEFLRSTLFIVCHALSFETHFLCEKVVCEEVMQNYSVSQILTYYCECKYKLISKIEMQIWVTINMWVNTLWFPQ